MKSVVETETDAACSSILRVIGEDQSEKALRDKALVHCFFYTVLTQVDIVSLDVEHLDFEKEQITVGSRNRQGERKSIMIPSAVRDALRDYLRVRCNPTSGPVFKSFDPTRKGDGRMTTMGVRGILSALAERAGTHIPRRTTQRLNEAQDNEPRSELRQLGQDWIDTLKIRNLSPKTQTTYKSALSDILDFLERHGNPCPGRLPHR